MFTRMRERSISTQRERIWKEGSSGRDYTAIYQNRSDPLLFSFFSRGWVEKTIDQTRAFDYYVHMQEREAGAREDFALTLLQFEKKC